jgi:hypothetical protein
MARTTAIDVKAIMEENELTDPQIEAYITGANLFVTGHLDGKGLTVATMTEIERWYAAHLIAMTKERQIKKAGAGGAEVEYTGYWSYGLLATNYGQVAISLDTTGTLEMLAKGKMPAWTKAVPTAKYK